MPYRLNAGTTFVNPYNFVSVDVARPGSKKAGRLRENDTEIKRTGRLKCRLIVKTPLAIPGKLISGDAEHKKYLFFEYEKGKPVIPGSSLRGAIRSVFETASDSCFSTAKEDQVITMRGKMPLKPGILKKEGGGWKLYPAQRYLVKVPDRGYTRFYQGPDFQSSRNELLSMGYGSKIRFQSNELEYRSRSHLVGKYVTAIDNNLDGQPGADWKEGYLYIGERFSRKHFESVFFPDTRAETIKSDKIEVAIKKLDEVYRLYNDESVNRNLNENEKFYAGYEAAKENGILPIWWNWDSEAEGLYLSLACIGRQAGLRTMGDVLQKKIPCRDRTCLCEACALFGMTVAPGTVPSEDSDEGRSIGSRIRITDASLELPDNGYYMDQTLKELSSPRISYLPFYTEQPSMGRGTWNYDNPNVKIRGRKYYWHGTPQQENAEKNKRNATMQLVKENVEFVFWVYYDGITDDQYRKLLWTLTLGDNCRDSSYCYKLGHGKPLGFGSVKILVEKMDERIMDFENSERKSVPYQIKTESLSKMVTIENPFSSVITGEMLKILNRRTMEGRNISYPFVIMGEGVDLPNNSNSIASHQWFGQNYRFGSNGNPVQPMGKLEDRDAGAFVMKAYEYYDENANVPQPVRNQKNDRAVQPVGNDTYGTHLKNGEMAEATVTNLDRYGNAYISLSEGRRGMIREEYLRAARKNLKPKDRISVKYEKTIPSNGKHIYKPT